MKLLTVVLSCVIASLALANDVGPSLAKTDDAAKKSATEMTPQEKAERSARLREKIMRYTGGRLKQPGSGMGFVAFVSAQSKVDLKEIEEVAAVITRDTRVDTKISLADAKKSVEDIYAECGSKLAVVIIDNPESKLSLLVAPETGWASINVSALSADAPDAKTLAKRLRIEVMRAFAMVMGGVGSQYQGNMMDPVRKPKDLEAYLEELPIDVMEKFKSFGLPFGVKPYRFATYREAVREGWAEAPKDEYQKACLELVEKERAKAKSSPAKPMPIKFDPKKGE